MTAHTEWQTLAIAAVVGAVATALLVPVWVYRDARARGSERPLFWGLFAALPGWGLIAYYVVRSRRLGERRDPPGAIDRAIETLFVALVGTFVAGAVLTPPDPKTQIYWTAGSLPAALAGAYVLVYRRGWDRLRGRLA